MNKTIKNRLTKQLLWDEMPDEIQQSVERGIKQADKGELKSHDVVMKKYKKWLEK